MSPLAVTVAATAVRLGRRTSRGLVALCACLALWVTGLILLESPGYGALAERVLPAGMLLAGAFAHAGAELAELERRYVVRAMYAASAIVGAIGAAFPRLFYGPLGRGAGLLFWPIALVCAVGSAALISNLVAAARRGEGVERRRRYAVALGCSAGAIGGGGVIGLRVLGLGDVWMATPFLVLAIALVAYAVVAGEHGRARRMLTQGLISAVATAFVSSLGLVVFFRALPTLAPSSSTAWLVVIAFFAILPMDPLRTLAVEAIARRLFAEPIGVRDLADAVERGEARADHAERLAEIGRLASAVAHEIRNPLGVIAAQAKLLERQGAKPETVAALKKQIERAKRFLEDLLRYSKPRPLDLIRFNARPALELGASDVRTLIGPSARIAITCADDLQIEADRAAFSDVAMILMHNAAIAMEGREGEVRVTSARAKDAVVITFEDDGPGVPEALEATLFEPFVTGRGRDDKHPGTGLGLAIAARWVQRHGGSIKHERPEKGARFIVTWPA
jgi:signal transduction histidine kinase